MLLRLLEDPNEEGDEADYSISDYAVDVEMREARARYCRCVYETTPLPERSAEVLGALAACCLLNGEAENSRRIIDEYWNQRFNRHSAFRRELDSLIPASGLLHWQPPAGV
ncbi:hypothetical protein ES708_25732 [subsurface metagenome]